MKSYSNITRVVKSRNASIYLCIVKIYERTINYAQLLMRN